MPTLNIGCRPHAGTAAQQRPRPPVLGAGDAGSRGHRKRAARRPHQQRRGQYRRVSAPPDGATTTSWSAPGRCSPRPSKRTRVADPLTDDRLLGGRVRFSQPTHGYRVAIDPVLLAAAVPAQPGERVLDAGAGTGAASLCLAARVPRCRIVGLELQRPLQRIASQNVTQNEFDGQVEMIEGDLQRPPPRLAAATFDHVMTNPPHLAATRAELLAGSAACARPPRDGAGTGRLAGGLPAHAEAGRGS